MDVNGTRFHLVLTARDWLGAEASAASAVEWRGGALRLRRELAVFAPAAGRAPLDPAARRGAARDRAGTFWWITPDGGELRFRRAGTEEDERCWPPAEGTDPDARAEPGAFVPRQALLAGGGEMRGVAVTADGYVVAGVVRPPGLRVFDPHAGGPPAELAFVAESGFSPWELAAAPGGGMWVLDRAGRTLQPLDRQLRGTPAPPPGGPPPPAFLPVAAPGAAPGPADADAPPAALRLEGAADPLALEALPDGGVLVLDGGAAGAGPVVRRYGPGGALGAVALAPLLAAVCEPGAAPPAGAYDLAFVPAADDPRQGTLYVVTGGGDQAAAFDYAAMAADFTLTVRPEFVPLRRFGGMGVVGTAEGAFYDSADRWTPLAPYPRPRFAERARIVLPPPGEAAGSSAGGPAAAAFDGGDPGCVWHRLLVDGCIPADARVEVESRAADQLDVLDRLSWLPEPLPYLRQGGAELPFHRPDPGGVAGRTGTWELLFQRATGRWLQLRLTLTGSGRGSPRLQALRIHYPRFSYLREYLPAVYREDPVSASFLERWLANPEGFFTVLEGRIAAVETLFDPRTVPAEHLEWLAGWMGLSLDLAWPERTRRLFLAHVPRMLRERGTRAGVARAVRLALDPCPPESLFTGDEDAGAAGGFGVRVVEGYEVRRAPGVVFGDPTDVLGPGSTAAVSAWTPALGAEPLHQRWREHLAAVYGDVEALNAAWGCTFSGLGEVRLPAVRPCGETMGRDWERFVRGRLGFAYAAADDRDEPLYREFLARRHRAPAEVERAYGLALPSFAAVRERLWDTVLRHALPSGGPFLRDWIEFASRVLPAYRGAHRFVVLVPARPGEDPAEGRSRLELARRVVEMEKPAHTRAEVKLFWAAFRVGEARVGMETVAAGGSRSAVLVLDRGAVGGGHLAGAHPSAPADRVEVGRERHSSADQRTG